VPDLHCRPSAIRRHPEVAGPLVQGEVLARLLRYLERKGAATKLAARLPCLRAGDVQVACSGEPRVSPQRFPLFLPIPSLN